MLIGLISDTHENVPAIARAVTILKHHAPQLVIHCGDIISPPVLEKFSGLPMRLVFGNNDGERVGLRKKALELGFGEVDDTLELDLEGKLLWVYHGTREAVLDEGIRSQRYDLVFHGHTHVQRDETIGKSRVINPGALFAAEVYSIALLDTKMGTTTFVEVPQ